MSEENSIPFAPFAAINEFMRPQFRLQVIEDVYLQLDVLPEETRRIIDHLARQYILVQGFRNPNKSPARLRAKASIEAFEKHSDFAGEILFAWLELKHVIAGHVAELLNEQGWERILPTSADRTQMPGFYIQWPAGYNFDQICHLYRERYPQDSAGDDQISLATVLVSMRLPYEEEE